MRCSLVITLATAAALASAQVDTVQRGAAVTVKVGSFPAAESSLAALAAKYHGSVADRRHLTSEGGRHSGWTRVILPKAQLDPFLADVHALGKLYGEKLTLQEHGLLYEDLGKRAVRLREHEARLAGILTGRRNLRGSDVLYVQERLYRASTDEDTLTERQALIPAAAAQSSVLVTLFEPDPVKPAPRGALGHVKSAFTDAFRGLAFGLLSLVGPLLNLLIAAALAILGWRLLRRPLRRALLAARRALDAWINPPPAEGV